MSCCRVQYRRIMWYLWHFSTTPACIADFTKFLRGMQECYANFDHSFWIYDDLYVFSRTWLSGLLRRRGGARKQGGTAAAEAGVVCSPVCGGCHRQVGTVMGGVVGGYATWRIVAARFFRRIVAAPPRGRPCGSWRPLQGVDRGEEFFGNYLYNSIAFIPHHSIVHSG